MYKPNSDSYENTEGWRSINWQQVERYVFKLQKRIYAASRCGDVRRVRKLQKTLMSSWSNRVLAVRRVTVENQGKKTAGVDGVKSLPPEARLSLVERLKLTGKSMPTRRVWIPKPGRDEKRPLGIPTMYDRSLQSVVKAAIEPEWEAIFEPSSYGFRPGRSCHDAVAHIKLAIKSKSKFVLDADISRCFDCINHEALLQKLNMKGKVRQQIKAWLKSGVIDKGAFTATSEGTPQGGVISPLLANIALHGLENTIKDFAESLNMINPLIGRQMSKRDKRKSLTFIRYADDFVLLHYDKSVVQRCREIISEWLAGIGLQLKPEKTRLTHTLVGELSEDGIAGFDFLGHHIQQYPAGKYRGVRDTRKDEPLGFISLITPTKKACKVHQEEIKKLILKHRHSPQAALIADLNPVIRGWANYYKNSDSYTAGNLHQQNHLTYLKLRRWSKYRCKTARPGYIKYWITIKGRKVFATSYKGSKPFQLITHSEIGSSSRSYVKVQGDKSPYDGNLIYWSSRLGKHPEMPTRKACLLKQQKGKCARCGLHFQDEDVLEVDHIVPRTLGGKDEYINLQLLHRHCHDGKTVNDGSLKSCMTIRKHIE
jgi:RNA-directed DNA polymerase